MLIFDMLAVHNLKFISKPVKWLLELSEFWVILFNRFTSHKQNHLIFTNRVGYKIAKKEMNIYFFAIWLLPTTFSSQNWEDWIKNQSREKLVSILCSSSYMRKYSKTFIRDHRSFYEMIPIVGSHFSACKATSL